MSSILDAIGKVFDWLPNRREHYRNKMESIERQMDELQKRGLAGSNGAKYESLARKLWDYRQRAKNT